MNANGSSKRFVRVTTVVPAATVTVALVAETRKTSVPAKLTSVAPWVLVSVMVHSEPRGRPSMTFESPSAEFRFTVENSPMFSGAP